MVQRGSDRRAYAHRPTLAEVTPSICEPHREFIEAQRRSRYWGPVRRAEIRQVEQ